MIEQEERWDSGRVEQPDFLIFGDGLFGGVIQKITRESINDGIKVKKIVFEPSPELIQAFNIQPEDIRSDGTIRMEYPSNMILLSSHDPMFGRRTFVLCDFYGNETAITSYYKGLLIKNTELQKEKELYKSYVARYYKDLQLMTHKQIDWWGLKVELIEKLGKVAGPKYYLGESKKLRGLPDESENE